MTVSQYPDVAVRSDSPRPEASVLPAALELLESAGLTANWRIVAGQAPDGDGGRKPEAGLLPPFAEPGASAYGLARAARRAWGGTFSVIERRGPLVRSDGTVNVLLFRYELDMSDTGMEFESNSGEQLALVKTAAELGPREIPEQAALGIQAIAPDRVSEFVRTAVGMCRRLDVDDLVVAHKGNSIKHTDGLFALTAAETLESLAGAAGIAWRSLIIDHMAAELVRNPLDYRAILTHSSFADLLAAALAGQMTTDQLGVCTTYDPAGRPLFGHDPALDTSAPDADPERWRVRRLASTLAAGAALAEHLRLPPAGRALRRAAAELVRRDGGPIGWDQAVTTARKSLRAEGPARS
ncbi:hypothetical protein VM98_22900 [Streptomyces rubellomurinus subsp. indigoferus]|uniref:FrbB n=1 Tax=Streptomyces rubellomurinus (strain ATCC 31215) TaxID=359131 RepID=Q0ZQ47_STRR3|nr:isocitrate/isopropylmalate family dehydrogenase [Streptomyces rubellomurinus]ABB90391.1 FrbB [Streptomyces rubellomurinus]KJS53827.1 hypothetical protein VM98_22900 [Streptomyces rubellomurinus subsp. indigoferus]KJS60086.1 hypothetical protein VM95_23200 [Streptomyces rubellomurinus]